MGNNYRERLKAANEVLSEAVKTAYKDEYLLSNQVLSKIPFNNDYFEYFLAGEEPDGASPLLIAKKAALYYAKSAVHYVLYLLKIALHLISGQRAETFKVDEDVVLIDVVFLVDRIRESGGFIEKYFFPGLGEFCERNGVRCAYLPFFYSSSCQRKPFELFKVFRILKKQRWQVLTEFQLLTFSDVLLVGWFMLAYPFHVLRYRKTLRADIYGNRLLRYALVNGLDSVSFYSYIRNRIGRRIASLMFRHLKVISWYENQPSNKNLIKGLRSGSGRITVYGAQLFPRSVDYRFIMPDENEKPFGIIPDIMVVGGERFMGSGGAVPLRLGPSLRSRRLFNERPGVMRGGDVVVFLHLFEKDTARMLRILGDPLLSHHKFILKPHPGLPLSRLRRLIPANARIVEEDIYSLLSSARAVIGAGSGSMVEAVASGVPVICIKGGRQFDYNRGFFDKGEGIIWAEAASAAELLTQLERIGKSAESGETMQELAREYADHYFCRPTEDLIRSAFDFDHPKRKGRYDG